MPILDSPVVSYVLVFQYDSPYPTNDMLESAGILADEIVATRHSDHLYVYVHLCNKTRQGELEGKLGVLATTHGLKLSNIIGCSSLNTRAFDTSEGAEEYRAFRLIVQCDDKGDLNFRRWTAVDFPDAGRGYTRLKARISAASGSLAKSGIYVLRLDARSVPFYYVGKASNIELRIQQHKDGTGASCIAGEQFTCVKPLTEGSVKNMEAWERDEVLTRMFKHGIDNVRGWMYTMRTMSLYQKVSAFDQICEKFDLCRRCGGGTHFVRDCHALTTDLWARGMALRTAYTGTAMREFDEEERRHREAEYQEAEAALARAMAEQQDAESAMVRATAKRRAAEALWADAKRRMV